MFTKNSFIDCNNLPFLSNLIHTLPQYPTRREKFTCGKRRIFCFEERIQWFILIHSSVKSHVHFYAFVFDCRQHTGQQNFGYWYYI